MRINVSEDFQLVVDGAQTINYIALIKVNKLCIIIYNEGNLAEISLMFNLLQKGYSVYIRQPWPSMIMCAHPCMIETIYYQAFMLLCRDGAFPNQQNLYFFAGVVLSPTNNYLFLHKHYAFSHRQKMVHLLAQYPRHSTLSHQ